MKHVTKIRQVRCVCDEYDPDGSVPYASVTDFFNMVKAVHGVDAIPDLHQRRDGNWYKDGSGTLVLVEVAP